MVALSYFKGMLTTIHKENPKLIFVANDGWNEIKQVMFQFFQAFVAKTRPLPEFERGNLRERQENIARYYKDFFTHEKHLILRAENNGITGFALFDPFCYSLEGARENDVELVIGGTLDGNTRKSKRDLLLAFSLYKKEIGEKTIALNINREYKRSKFEKFVTKILGFKKISENYYGL